MLQALRQRASDEGGFTLIELLVVILIIGILAAIAIPAFLNQTQKANDSSAKALARNAATFAQTFGTEKSGSFTGLTPTEINKLEKSIEVCSGGKAGKNACLNEAKAVGSEGYMVETIAPTTEDKYVYERNEAGETVRTCTTAGKGGCPSTGSW